MRDPVLPEVRDVFGSSEALPSTGEGNLHELRQWG